MKTSGVLLRSPSTHPAVLVTAVNGLLDAAHLFSPSDADAERAIAEALGVFLDGEGRGEVRDWRVAQTSLPRRRAGAVELHAFILIQAGGIAEVELFESEAEAAAHGLRACKERFGSERAAACESFDQVVEMDADHDCSVYVVRLRAEGGTDAQPPTGFEPSFEGREEFSLTCPGVH
jgi:hypothetical protein